MNVTRSFASRPIAPNIAETGPLLLVEAFKHLLQGRLLGFASEPWPLAVIIFALIVGLLASPSFASHTIERNNGLVSSETTSQAYAEQFKKRSPKNLLRV